MIFNSDIEQMPIDKLRALQNERLQKIFSWNS